MMKKIILILMIVFLLASPIMAKDVFQKDTEVIISEPIRINGWPSSSIDANITIKDPDNNILVDFKNMTNNQTIGEHQFVLRSGNTSQLGDYPYCITATDGTFNKTQCFSFTITPNGFSLGTGQAFLYGVFIFVGLVIFALSLLGAIVIPFHNPRDEEGFIVGMNDLKYIKIFLWFFTYIVALFIAFLSRGITGGFLFIDTAALFFKWIYQFMLAFLFPVIVVSGVIAFVNFIGDRGIMGDISRGLKIK